MTALLAVLAIAGYQNRDKIAEWVKSAQGKLDSPSRGSGASAVGGPPGNLGGALAGRSIGDLLSNGLRDLVDSFKQAGHGEAADSWIGHGPNKQIGPSDLERALGPDVLATLSQQTGLSREEILSRLSKNFPTQWTNIPPRGASPPRPSWGKFTSSGTSHNQHLNSRPVIGPRLGAHPPSEPQHHANRTSSITDEHTRTPY